MALSMAGVLTLQAQASGSLPVINPYLNKIAKEAKPVRQFRGEKPWGIWSNTNPVNLKNGQDTRTSIADPDINFPDVTTFDFLEGPDNSTWFYIAEYEKEYYQFSEWYTEEYITAYKFTIYDSEFQEIGTIQDKVTLKEGESKIAYAALDPALSRFFFNDDENVEAMVYIAVNTGEEYGYEVHYYNKVYSVGGEKDEEGNDISINILPGRCVDAFNAGSGNGASGENFFFSFVEDMYPDPDDFDFDRYIDYINAAKTVVSVYNKDKSGLPSVVFEKDIYFSRYPGDTTEGIYLISRLENGMPYFIFSQYEKPYFIDPTGFATNESATPDNNLLIETFAYNEENMNLVSTTRIPVEIPTADGQIAYYFYSIGSVAWKNDIDTKVNGSPDAPAYVVARDYTTAAQLEDVVSDYFIYGNDGTPIRTLCETVDGIVILNSDNNEEPHALFITIDERDGYVFNFINLFSGKKLFTILQNNDGDPLTAACQRVKNSDGSYNYAFEMEYDELSQEGNDLKRIAWFNEDGSFNRIDKINMGQDVMFATVNMYPECLKPDLFDTDDAIEYAILVKRAYGYTTRNEFMVIDDNGDYYAHFTADDGKGEPVMFSIVPGKDFDSLQMVYNEDLQYNIDIYYLPFISEAGVGSIPADQDGGKIDYIFDGDNLIAQGCFIEVMNIRGMTMISGKDSVSLSSLPKGVYIGRLTDKNGKKYSFKYAI